MLERMLCAHDRNDHRVRDALGWALSKVPGVQKSGQLPNELMLEQMVIRSAGTAPR